MKRRISNIVIGIGVTMLAIVIPTVYVLIWTPSGPLHDDLAATALWTFLVGGTLVMTATFPGFREDD